MSLSPPPPPLPSTPPLFHLHSPGNTSFPVIAIAIIGILATAFLLVSYYIFVIKCCLNWHRVDIFNRFFSRVRDPNDDIPSSANNALSSDGNTAVQKGLEEALIRAIPVIEFRKLKAERKVYNHKAAEEEAQAETAASYECAVCLSEFEEGERLRVIPNCCHAFHIDCIDIWLQSNANCPLCRSGISPASILYNNQQKIINHIAVEDDEEQEQDDDDDDDDYVVIEIHGNNLDEPRMVSKELSLEEKKKGRYKKLGHVYSMGDELLDMRRKNKDEEFDIIQPIRRSISMDLSSDRDFCLEISECCRNNNVRQESEVSSSSSKVRRSIFSFGYGRSSSRCSVVQPVHLDP